MRQTANRQGLFYAIALLIPLAFFSLIELGLRAVDYGQELSLFVPAPEGYAKDDLLVINSNVSKRYFSAGYNAPRPPLDFFRKQKPENGYRIFVMGGSTVAGWPYPHNVLFTRVLEQRLSDVFPGKYIEVINTGMAAVNSFTLLDFIDEILDQQPDAILIYAGHNEFYGALGAGSTQSVGQQRWLILAYLKLAKLKLFQLVRDLIDLGMQTNGTDVDQSGNSSLMSKMVGDNRIVFGDETYQTTLNNYEENLRDIVTAAKAKGVNIMLSEVVSNLRDHPPFGSYEGGESLSADLYYAWGKALEQAEIYDMARHAYIAAKEQDVVRFRAPEEINQRIHNVARQFELPVVPMQAHFESASVHGIIGNDLMLEHLHPNVEGYFLMSDAFFDALRNERFISETWEVNEVLSSEFYQKAWPITEIDRSLGEIRIINLTDNYPFKPKSSGQRSMENFVPRDGAETLAYKTYQDEISFVDAHAGMAAEYESIGQLGMAFREYQALIQSEPNTIDYYMIYGDFLVKLRELERALQVFKLSLDIKETGYAYKWIGQILLIMQRPKDALRYLEKALMYFPEDVQGIYNLGFVHVTLDRVEDAKVSVGLLKRIAPESNQLNSLEALLDRHVELKQRENSSVESAEK